MKFSKTAIPKNLDLRKISAIQYTLLHTYTIHPPHPHAVQIKATLESVQAEFKLERHARMEAELAVTQLELEVKKLQADLHVSGKRVENWSTLFDYCCCGCHVFLSSLISLPHFPPSFLLPSPIQASCLQEEESSSRVDQLVSLERSRKSDLHRLRTESDNLQNK